MQSTGKVEHSRRLVVALKHQKSNRDKNKSHAAEEKREHGKIDGGYNSRANDCAYSHARVGGHVLNAVRRATVGDGQALRRRVSA